MAVRTYKCPNCGAAMLFNSQTQMLTCPSCKTNFNVNDYDSYIKNLDEEYGKEESSSDYESEYNSYDETNETKDYSEDMKVFHCQSCGAQLVTDKYTSATFCSYCGNPSLVEDRLEGEFSPEYVIPFKINKEEAIKTYKTWLKKGALTPKALASSATIEKISGVYVPFWLYDFDAIDDMDASATRTRTSRRGDTEYIYTDHYHVHRNVSARFEKIPADSSKKMPDERMDKLEPYNYADLEDFKEVYLQGFLSERYNYNAQELDERARTRARNYIRDIARDTIQGYSTVTVLSNKADLNELKQTYALLPVWMLNFNYKGSKFSFYLNGQTGKIVADRPRSTVKTVFAFVLTFIITFIILTLGGLLIQ